MAKRINPEGFILALALVVGLIAVMLFRPMPTDAAIPTIHWYKDWGQGGIDWSNESDVKELEDAIRWDCMPVTSLKASANRVCRKRINYLNLPVT